MMSLLHEINSRALQEMAKPSLPCPDCGQKIQGNHYYYKGKRVCQNKTPDPSQQKAATPAVAPTTQSVTNPKPTETTPATTNTGNTSRQQQEQWLNALVPPIKDYTFDEQGRVNAPHVVIQNIKETKLPVQFGKISGVFHLLGGNLTTLEGCPEYVGGTCFIQQPKLKDFKGAPQNIVGELRLINVQPETSFEGLPPSLPLQVTLFKSPLMLLYKLISVIKKVPHICVYMPKMTHLDENSTIPLLDVMYIDSFVGLDIICNRSGEASSDFQSNLNKAAKIISDAEDIFQAQEELRKEGLNQFAHVSE